MSVFMLGLSTICRFQYNAAHNFFTPLGAGDSLLARSPSFSHRAQSCVSNASTNSTAEGGCRQAGSVPVPRHPRLCPGIRQDAEEQPALSQPDARRRRGEGPHSIISSWTELLVA